MLEDSRSNTKKKFDIPLLQRRLFKVLVLLLPLAIFPFPWDWTERAMSLLILSISTIILGLEIIKLVWDGKTSVLKSTLDLGFFLVLLSMLLSTIFSLDIYTSLWGIDGRLGNGLIVFIAIFLVTIVSRVFLEGEKDVRSVILFFLIGFSINNFFSLLSFFGINIWGLLPVYRDLYQTGLPLLRNSKVHLLLNFVSIILSLGFIVEYLIDGKRQLEFILSIIFALLSIINIWFYSINQSLGLTLSFLLIVAGLLFLVMRSFKAGKETSKQILLLFLIGTFLIAIPIIFLKIPRITDAFLGGEFEIFTEVGLGFDITWIITGSVLVSGLVGGLFGLGVGTFPIAYQMFKPLDLGLLVLGNATFHSGVNEVMTRAATGGLLWILVWLFLGYLIVKGFVADLQSANTSPDKSVVWRFLIVDVVILTIFISSLLVTYSVLVMFLLLTFVSIRSVIREKLSQSTEEKFVLKFWALNMSTTPKGDKSLQSFNIFLTALVSCIAFVLIMLMGARAIASTYVLRAEAFAIQENRKFEEDQGRIPTLEEREQFLTSMDSFYSNALRFDRRNPLYNRKMALVQLESIGVLVERFAEVDEEDTVLRDQYIDAVMAIKSNMTDFGRKSTEISSSVYANWLTRSTIYTGLVGIGFNEHIPDALRSLERAANLNPLNFQLYYSMAQVYIVRGEQENAIALLARVLEINPQHIPSILLIADLSKEEGNIELYASYLQVAQQILENEEATELEVYQEILAALEELEREGFDLEAIEQPELGELEETELEIEEIEEQEALFDTGLEEGLL